MGNMPKDVSQRIMKKFCSTIACSDQLYMNVFIDTISAVF